MNGRKVYLIREDDGFIALCEPCIASLADVPRGVAAIVGRCDDAHCIECDYHAPTCPATCAARDGLAAYMARPMV